MSSRIQENRTSFNVLFEIARTAIHAFIEDATLKASGCDLQTLMNKEVGVLNNGIGSRLYTKDKPPQLSEEGKNPDISGLCHVLLSLPSLGFKGKQVSSSVFVGSSPIEASLIIKNLRNKASHGNSESTLLDHSYIIDGYRLMKNITVVGYEESEIYEAIDFAFQTRVHTTTSSVEATQQGDTIDFNENNIEEKLLRIFSQNTSISIDLYRGTMRMENIITADELEQIHKITLNTLKQNFLINALKSRGRRGIEVLYKKAKSTGHRAFASGIKNEFHLDD